MLQDYKSLCKAVTIYSTTFVPRNRSRRARAIDLAFLAHDAFLRTNRRATAMMFVRLCLSVRLGRACIVIRCMLTRIYVYRWIVRCSGHADTKTCPPIFSRFFQFQLEEKLDGISMCKLGVISQERLKIEVKLLLTIEC